MTTPALSVIELRYYNNHRKSGLRFDYAQCTERQYLKLDENYNAIPAILKEITNSKRYASLCSDYSPHADPHPVCLRCRVAAGIKVCQTEEDHLNCEYCRFLTDTEFEQNVRTPFEASTQPDFYRKTHWSQRLGPDKFDRLLWETCGTRLLREGSDHNPRPRLSQQLPEVDSAAKNQDDSSDNDQLQEDDSDDDDEEVPNPVISSDNDSDSEEDYPEAQEDEQYKVEPKTPASELADDLPQDNLPANTITVTPETDQEDIDQQVSTIDTITEDPVDDLLHHSSQATRDTDTTTTMSRSVKRTGKGITVKLHNGTAAHYSYASTTHFVTSSLCSYEYQTSAAKRDLHIKVNSYFRTFAQEKNRRSTGAAFDEQVFFLVMRLFGSSVPIANIQSRIYRYMYTQALDKLPQSDQSRRHSKSDRDHRRTYSEHSHDKSSHRPSTSSSTKTSTSDKSRRKSSPIRPPTHQLSGTTQAGAEEVPVIYQTIDTTDSSNTSPADKLPTIDLTQPQLSTSRKRQRSDKASSTQSRPSKLPRIQLRTPKVLHQPVTMKKGCQKSTSDTVLLDDQHQDDDIAITGEEPQLSNVPASQIEALLSTQRTEDQPLPHTWEATDMQQLHAEVSQRLMCTLEEDKTLTAEQRRIKHDEKIEEVMKYERRLRQQIPHDDSTQAQNIVQLPNPVVAITEISSGIPIAASALSQVKFITEEETLDANTEDILSSTPGITKMTTDSDNTSDYHTVPTNPPDTTQDSTTDLERSVREQDKKTAELQHQLSKLREEVHTYNTEIAQYNTNIKTLSTEHATALKAYKVSKSKNEYDIKSWEKKKKQRQTDLNEQQKKDNEDWQRQLKAAEAENEKFKDEKNEILKTHQTDTDLMQSQIETAQARKTQITAEAEESKQIVEDTLKRFQEEFQKRQVEHSDKKKKMEEESMKKQEELNGIREEKNKLNTELTALEQQTNQLREQLVLAASQKAEVEKETHHLRQLIEPMREQICRLTEDNRRGQLLLAFLEGRPSSLAALMSAILESPAVDRTTAVVPQPPPQAADDQQPVEEEVDALLDRGTPPVLLPAPSKPTNTPTSLWGKPDKFRLLDTARAALRSDQPITEDTPEGVRLNKEGQLVLPHEEDRRRSRSFQLQATPPIVLDNLIGRQTEYLSDLDDHLDTTSNTAVIPPPIPPSRLLMPNSDVYAIRESRVGLTALVHQPSRSPLGRENIHPRMTIPVYDCELANGEESAAMGLHVLGYAYQLLPATRMRTEQDRIYQMLMRCIGDGVRTAADALHRIRILRTRGALGPVTAAELRAALERPVIDRNGIL